MNIKINIADKRPTVIGAPVIVCGNNDYTIEFTFDTEWDAATVKTARFVFYQAGEAKYLDVIFAGSTVAVPVLSDIREVMIGVYAGDLRTTTPARIPCDRSILCGTGVEYDEPDPDVYNQILEELNKLAGQSADHPARTDNPHGVTAAQVGARPADWLPAPDEINAIRRNATYYSATSEPDIDTLVDAFMLVPKAYSKECPVNDTFVFIRQYYYGTPSETSNRTQVAYPYRAGKGMALRYYVNGNGWTKWQKIYSSSTPPTAEEVGARPDTWLPTAEEVGARPDTWLPTADQVGARPNTWTPTADQVGARPNTWTPTAEEVGARPADWVPTAEEIGIDPSKLDITPEGIGAAKADHTHTAAEVGARPADWVPTAAEVGARPADWTPTAQEVGARPADWVPTTEEIGAFPMTYVPGGLAAYAVSVGGNASVRFRVSANLLLIGRLTGAAATAASVFAIAAYNEYRAPVVAALSAGTNVSVTTGGDNTNGWYVELSCSHGAGANFYLIGNCIPTFI